MKIGSTLLWGFAAAVAGAGLFVLKGQVQAEERRLTELNHEITDTRTAIHVQNANWAFLNDPSRLSEEAQTLLALQPMGPNQIGSIEQIPIGPRDPAPGTGVPGSVPVAGAAPAKPIVLASGKPVANPNAAIIAAKAPPKPIDKLPPGTKVLAPAQKAAAAQAAKSEAAKAAAAAKATAAAAKPTSVAAAKSVARSGVKPASVAAAKPAAASVKPVAELVPGSTVRPLNFGPRPAGSAQAAKPISTVPPAPVAVPKAVPVLKVVPAKDVTR